MSLSFPNPALTNALTNVPARFPRAESTFADKPPPVGKPDVFLSTQARGDVLTRILQMTFVHIFQALGFRNANFLAKFSEEST